MNFSNKRYLACVRDKTSTEHYYFFDDYDFMYQFLDSFEKNDTIDYETYFLELDMEVSHD